jgi:type VI secretion system secreted protein Hcp
MRTFLIVLTGFSYISSYLKLLFMRKFYAFLLLVAGLFISSHLVAQGVDVFLKVDGVDGGSTVEGFVKQIPILSYSHGAAGCPSSTNIKDEACKVVSSSFNFMTAIDPSQIPLKRLLLTGKLIPSATLSYVILGAPPLVFYIIKLENVLVNSIQESGSSENPTFSLSFIAQKVSWTHYRQRPDGTREKIDALGWDFSKNAAFTPTE